jgi:uncharacterized protein involved in exopolysaccharide biosynthesis
MKSSDKPELKPVYIHEASHSTSEEINLIDLAMVLIRHKTMIAIVFITTLALGLFLALSTPRVYTFSTTLEIGSRVIDGSIQPFEPPQALIAKLQYSYIPRMLHEHKKSSPGDKNKYRITSSVPSGSNLALLETQGTEDQTDILIKLLQMTSQKAIQDHNRIFQSIKRSLETSLNQANSNLKTLNNDDNNESKIITYQNTIEKLTSELANLRNTRVVMLPMRSLEPTGRSRKTIVMVSVFAGVFLGVFIAFFAEFLSKVKLRIAKEKNS